MNHLSENLLNEFLDDELTAKARAEVETHLTGCSECQASLEELRGLFAELKQLPDETPSSNLSALALTRLSGSRLSKGTRLGLILQAGMSLGLLVVIFKYIWGYIAVLVDDLYIWEKLSQPISIQLPAIALSMPEFPAWKVPIPLPVLILMLIIVVAFWWLGNIRLLRNGNEH